MYDFIGDVIVTKYGKLLELERDKIASFENLNICFICSAKCQSRKGLKNHKRRKHSATLRIVKDILDYILRDANVTEYGELLKLKKSECSEETETVMATASHKKSHTEELEIFQDDVVSAVMTSMNQYFDVKKSSRKGTFLEIASELLNQLTFEIKESYRVHNEGLQNIHLTSDNRLSIRNQVECFLS